ncbi:MAG: methylmalonyl Co-A mutase-associated GTPase MeaB [Chloroflexi bacterium]|nr:methylmalonyl Co-A mutase-associated GTPase MeaB [Chloroflexota bacterium]
MRGIEDGAADAFGEMADLYPHTGKAYIVGITGAPGGGKSTLVDTLITTFRQRDMTLGVVAIDPTSPFTGGAILGDRVRMQKHSTDSGVFIRSVATRGWLGGLARAAVSIIHIMDAMGKDIILVETVGIGQQEVDVTRLADTSIFVLTPGSGDAIQMMKAGILEVADIFVVNKADLEGASRSKMELQAMLGMKSGACEEWEPSVLLTEAVNNIGIEELVDEILKHQAFLVSGEGMEKRRKERARLELTEAIESSLKDYIDSNVDKAFLEKLVDDLVQRRTNPQAAASQIIGKSIKR